MHSTAQSDAHAHHTKLTEGTNWLRVLTIGTALTAGAIILAPYVLPLVGIGDTALATKASVAMHGTGLGVGWVGDINKLLNSIPLVGGALAQGGLASAVATGALGIGGVLLGKFVEQRDDGTGSIRWGKVIRYGALISSAITALPSVLTGISVGIVYLCAAFSGVQLASTAVGYLADTLGAMGSMNAATAGIGGVAAVLPHLLSCGMSIIPVCTALLMGKSEPATTNHAHLAADTRVSSVNRESGISLPDMAAVHNR